MPDVNAAEWLRAFAITLLIEAPIYLVLLGRQGIRSRKALSFAIGVNAVSHPLLWFVMPRFEPYTAWLIVAETCVLAIEAMLLAGFCLPARHRWRKAFLIAFGANALSALIGVMLNASGALGAAATG